LDVSDTETGVVPIIVEIEGYVVAIVGTNLAKVCPIITRSGLSELYIRPIALGCVRYTVGTKLTNVFSFQANCSVHVEFTSRRCGPNTYAAVSVHRHHRFTCGVRTRGVVSRYTDLERAVVAIIVGSDSPVPTA
jgi:hypothetical protein